MMLFLRQILRTPPGPNEDGGSPTLSTKVGVAGGWPPCFRVSISVKRLTTVTQKTNHCTSHTPASRFLSALQPHSQS